MESRDIDAKHLNDEVIRAFLADHVDRHGQLPSAGVMPVLDYLRSVGVADPDPKRRLLAARRVLPNTGTGWPLSGRSRQTPSAGIASLPAGSSRSESRPRTSSGSRTSPALT